MSALYNLGFLTTHIGYSEEQEMAPNYKETIEKGNTKNWIDFFHVGYQTVTLDKQDLTWMEKALEIGVNTRKFSHLFDDELAATCAKHTFSPGVWFVRTNRVSLKEGCHGVGPYTSLEKVIESMVSTNLGHCCFNHSDNDCVIYLLPWLEIHPDKEFRIFVYNNHITALSSQHLYSVNEWLNDKSEAEIDAIVQRILVFFEARVKQPMSYVVCPRSGLEKARSNLTAGI